VLSTPSRYPPPPLKLINHAEISLQTQVDIDD